MISGLFFDFIEVKVLDSSGNEFLDDSLRRRAGSTPGWQESRIRIPAAALGRQVILQFSFTSDDFNAVDDATGLAFTQAGWAIDDVSVIPE